MISLPSQNIPESEKNQAWIDNNIQAIKRLAGYNLLERERDLFCYDMYNGVLPENQFDYLRKIESYEFPAKIRHIPIQRPRIDLLIGQELGRPIRLRTFCTNKDRVSLKQERKKLGILNTIVDSIVEQQINAQQLHSFLEQQKQMIQTQQQQEEMRYDQRIPMIVAQLEAKQKSIEQILTDIADRTEEIEKHYKYNYRDEVEIASDRIIKYIINEQHLHEKFVYGFTDSLICGKERYFVDTKYDNRPPLMHKLNPLRIQHSQDENAMYLHECNWVKMDNEMSLPEILDEFPELQLDLVKLKLISEMAGISDLNSNNEYLNTAMDPTEDFCEPNLNVRYVRELRNSPAKFTIDRCYWKSVRRINIKTTEKKDDPQIKFTHWVEDKEVGDGANIKYRYVEDVWMGVSIGAITIRSGRIKNQYRPIDNPSKAQLPFFGQVFNNRTRKPYSLVWATKDIQILYDIIHYQWELMMATAGNKGLIMDKAQMPKDMSMGEWRYQKKTGNTAWINSAQTYNNMKPTFNGFTVYDDSLSPSIQYLEGIMNKLEDLCGNAIGVPRQRLGALTQEDAVGNSKISNIQSSLITDIKYYEHDIIKNQVLTYMVNVAKRTLKTGIVGQVITGDLGQEMLSISPEVKNADLAIFLTDSTQEIQKLNELRNLASIGLKAGTVEYRNIIKSYSIDSVKELEVALDYYSELAEKKASANAQQQQAYEQQMQEQKLKVDQAVKQQEFQLKGMELELRKVEISIKKEEIAMAAEIQKYEVDQKILAERKKTDIERGVEMAYLAEDHRQANMEFSLNKEELALEASSIGVNAHLENKKIGADIKAKKEKIKNN